jgi:hypothetical protein
MHVVNWRIPGKPPAARTLVPARTPARLPTANVRVRVVVRARSPFRPPPPAREYVTGEGTPAHPPARPHTRPPALVRVRVRELLIRGGLLGCGACARRSRDRRRLAC